MRGYFEPPDISAEDQDPLLKPDRTSWSCLAQFTGVIALVLILVVTLFLGLYAYHIYTEFGP